MRSSGGSELGGKQQQQHIKRNKEKRARVFFFPWSTMISSLDRTFVFFLLPRQRHQEQKRPAPPYEHAVEGQRWSDGQNRVRRQDEHGEKAEEKKRKRGTFE